MASKAETFDDEYNVDIDIDSDLEALVASCHPPSPPKPKKRRSQNHPPRALTDRPRLRPLKPLHSTSLHSTHSETQNNNDKIWWQQYEPYEAADLAIHKARIEEVRGWLLQAQSNSTSPQILVLEGPAGSGKSTCLRILARELNIDIVEWENAPLAKLSMASIDSSTSLIHELEAFLAQAARYGVVSSGSYTRLVLIDDLPNVEHRDTREAFQRALARFAFTATCPLVLIVTDVRMDGEVVASTANNLVPADVVCHVIRFRPVAPTIVQRALRRILRIQLGMEGLPKSRQKLPNTANELVRRVSAECQGDLRIAVTMLQLESLVSPRKTPMDLFHALGKVVYAKRERLQGAQLRGALESNPDEILDQVPIDLSTFRLFLHQSYPEFCSSIDEVAASSSFMSEADCLGRDTTSEWCATSIAVRGYMLSARHPQLADSCAPSGQRKSNEFHRPQIFEFWRRKNNHAQILRQSAPLRVHMDELGLWAPLAARRNPGYAEAQRIRQLLPVVAPSSLEKLMPLLSVDQPEPEKLVLSDDDIEEFSDT
ncbi:Cell cycle checkpoint protein rad17 [Coemansia sp. RSA 989]|nr:Cell cycle checkpoint protein rad17 [Coemansia sp. RSA 1086]KAJ1751465.1 Cell cycle checkpoint protein rad17 [Coemansia sp. RSA 1821]KAJ1866510.1 Cell cycle checkpoint protein rad17 [Coemansia sp. RSA 989]KAJ1873842.1 Cell cycle checkpoint protein rad17 [Coemansia sp. RSA 990]KAJ2670419.1 Cell cycle checkpoint protein rad17 [Coemansia sp. RSA 1085]